MEDKLWRPVAVVYLAVMARGAIKVGSRFEPLSLLSNAAVRTSLAAWVVRMVVGMAVYAILRKVVCTVVRTGVRMVVRMVACKIVRMVVLTVVCTVARMVVCKVVYVHGIVRTVIHIGVRMTVRMVVTMADVLCM